MVVKVFEEVYIERRKRIRERKRKRKNVLTWQSPTGLHWQPKNK